MKRRLFHMALIVAVMFAGIAVGNMAGRVAPSPAANRHESPGFAIASALTIEDKSAAPLSVSAGSSFTYQGSLKSGSSPVNGSYDFRFRLYGAPEEGTQTGGAVAIDSVEVVDGVFTVYLDFGAGAFNGDARYLEVEVRPFGGSYSLLSPRQPISPAPYALFAQKTAPQKNVVRVAKSGGDFTTVTAALNSITDASSAYRYLIRIAPGVYTEQVTMKQWVDIEGSGEGTTTITFTGSGGEGIGTVAGASNSELRFLTVENTGGDTFATAIANISGSPSLLQVTAVASGGLFHSVSIVNWDSSPNISNVTASASGAPIFNYVMENINASPTILNSVLKGTHGVASFQGGGFGFTVTIDGSKLMGTTGTISSTGGTTRVGATQLSGGPVSGTVTCTASYDENYVSPGLNVCP